MNSDILQPFSKFNFTPFHYSNKEITDVIKIINDFIIRTNDFTINGVRNNFEKNYGRYLVSSQKKNSTDCRSYAFSDKIQFATELDKGQHTIERFHIEFSCDDLLKQKWLEVFRNSPHYEWPDKTSSIFISKLTNIQDAEINLQTSLDYEYNGPDKSHISSGLRGLNFTLKNINISQPRNLREVSELGIGQLKVALQSNSPRQMSIGITLSNVFQNVATARNMLGNYVASIFNSENGETSSSIYHDVLFVEIKDDYLASKLRETNEILEEKPQTRMINYVHTQYWVKGYSYNEFKEALEWKRLFTSQLFEDCKRIHKKFFINCKECGIAQIVIKIGSFEACRLKVI